MRFIQKITRFDKVIENIRKEYEEEEKRRQEYIEKSPEKAEALEKDHEEEIKMLTKSRKITVKDTIKQIWQLLAGMRRTLPSLFFLMLFNNILGLFSISLILPFSVAFDKMHLIGTNINMSNLKGYERVILRLLQYIYETLHIPDPKWLVLLLAAGFIMVFLLKTFFGLYLGYIMTVRSAEATRHFNARMFSALLYISYTYFLGRSAVNSSYALGLADRCYGIIFSLFSTINDLILMFLFGTGIAILTPPIILVGLGIFLISFLMYKLAHKEIKRISEISLQLGRSGAQNAYQGIHNFVFSRLFHAEPFFVRHFHKFIDYSIPMGAYKTIITSLPRLVVDNLIVIAFMGFAAYQVIFDKGSGDILTLAIVIGFAMSRLVPAIMRFIGYLSSFVGDQVNIDEFYQEYTTAVEHIVDAGEHENTLPLNFFDKIEVKNISYAYPEFNKKGIRYTYEDSPVVLKNINMTVKKGEKIGIIGTSGGGKTTFMHLLMAFLEPQNGTISVDGASVFDNMRAWHKNIGYVPQDTMLMSDTVLANIAFGERPEKINIDRAIKSLKSAHLWDVVEKMPLGIKTFIGDTGKRLSGGQRQRLGIARALYRNPSVLFFDEATSHLDKETEKEVQRAIDDIDTSKTVIIVAHRLNTLEKCDRIYAFDQGNIAFEGSYKDMIKKYG